MNRQTENFLNLIRAFLWNTEVNVADPDWNALFHMANIHNLIPAIYDAVYKLPCFSQAPSHIQKKFQESALYQSSVQFMRTQEFLTLNDEFQANDLHPRVLKGLICRSLYPQPDLRISCDEDLWIRAEDLPRYDRILRAHGYTPDFDDVTPILETIQEVTYESPVLTLELHTSHPFGTDDSIRMKMNQLFEHSFDRVSVETIEGHRVYTLSPTEHYLFLFTHLYKHFIVGGVGIRQILDLFLFYGKYRDQLDMRRIHSGITTLSGEEFYSAITEISRRHLGFTFLEPADAPSDVDSLLDDLVESGCFGNYTRAHSLSQGYMLSGERSHLRMIHLLFPPASRLYSTYPFLVRRPYLLPVAWCRRIIRLSKELWNDKPLLSRGVSRAKKRTKLLKSLHTIPFKRQRRPKDD